MTVSKPRLADWIAAQAHVAENVARDHLQRLVEMNVVQTVRGATATTYAPDPLYTRMQALRDLLDGRDHDGPLALRGDLQEQVKAWQTEYDAESPTSLREQVAGAETAAKTRAMRQTANDWEIVVYRLGLVGEAIEHYDRYTESFPASV